MATIKRKKVSTQKAVQGKSSKRIFHNIWFWIIGSISLAVLITVGIVGGIHVYNYYHQDEKVDYIGKETPHSYKDTPVVFTKMNYEGAYMHSNPNQYEDTTYREHIFFCAFDFTAFYPDPAIDAGKDKDDEDEVFYYSEVHKLALEALVKLQYTIDQYNSNLSSDDPSKRVELYLIDTSIESNKSIFSDALFGYAGESGGFVFGYIAGEDGIQYTYEYKKGEKDKEAETKSIFATDMETFRSTTITWVLDFITNKDFKLKLES